jgi:hypothetical protein
LITEMIKAKNNLKSIAGQHTRDSLCKNLIR